MDQKNKDRRHDPHVRHKRIMSIDCLRGIAMVLVILQHSYLSVNITKIPLLVRIVIWPLTSLAAVAFVAISGTIFSYYLHLNDNWRISFYRYAMRSIFLLLFAHIAINLTSYYFWVAQTGYALRHFELIKKLIFSFPITDTIAVCILISPVFIIKLNSLYRLISIIFMIIITPFMVTYFNPASPIFLLIKECLFGNSEGPINIWWPLVPWLAVFLIGSFIGIELSHYKLGHVNGKMVLQNANKRGMQLAISCILLVIGYKLLKNNTFDYFGEEFFISIYPGQTTGLLPGYLAVLAWLFAWTFLLIDVKGRYNRILWILSILGRTSLFTFIIQFAIVESIPALFGLYGSLGLIGFILLFALGMTAIVIIAYAYGRFRGWMKKDDYKNITTILADVS